MHPQEKVVIEGVVGLTCQGVDPMHLAVQAVDSISGLVRLGPGPEGHLRLHHQGSDQSRPRISLIHRGLPGSGSDEGVGGMHEQRAGSAEEHRHFLVDLPGDRIRAEIPAVSHRVMTLLRRRVHIDGSPERVAKCSDRSMT